MTVSAPYALRDQTAGIERLVPLAIELALFAAERGITICELRQEAERRQLLTGAEQGRSLSYLGAVMRAAGLIGQPGTFRRSTLPQSHGNLQRVWRARGVA